VGNLKLPPQEVFCRHFLALRTPSKLSANALPLLGRLGRGRARPAAPRADGRSDAERSTKTRGGCAGLIIHHPSILLGKTHMHQSVASRAHSQIRISKTKISRFWNPVSFLHFFGFLGKKSFKSSEWRQHLTWSYKLPQ